MLHKVTLKVYSRVLTWISKVGVWDSSFSKNRSPIWKKGVPFWKSGVPKISTWNFTQKSLTNFSYLSSKNFELKWSCYIVPEAAKGQGAEVEKSLHGQCNIYTMYSTKLPPPPSTLAPIPPAAALNPAHPQTQRSKSSLLVLSDG